MMRRLFLVLLVLLMPGKVFADQTINQLTPGLALTGSEQLPMFQGSNPAVTTTPAAFATYVAPFNLRSFGAKCDGATNDAAAINAAASAANAAGGGAVLFPAGVCIVGASIIIYPNVVYAGVGANVSAVKAANGLNAAVFLGQNFASLTGTNSTGGVGDFTIRDMTVDGNAANQTAGDCVQVYGYHYTITHFNYQHCFADGIYTEWSNSSSCPPGSPQCMEASISHIRGANYGGNGINFRGPHDSVIEDLTTFSYVAGAGDGIYLGGAAGNQFNGTLMTDVHLWGAHKYGLFAENGTGAKCENCQFEGATVAQVMTGILAVQLSSPHFYNCNSTTLTGSLSGNTLTVTAGPTAGAVAVGQQITGTGVAPGAVITAGSGVSWTFGGGPQTVVAEALTLMAAGIELGDAGHSSNGMQIAAGAMSLDCWLDFRYDSGGQHLEMEVNQFGYPASMQAYVGSPKLNDILNLNNVGNGGSPSFSACGTSPSAGYGNDWFGLVTIGSGTVTSCTLTFNYPWPASRPILCTMQAVTSGAPPAALNGLPTSTGFVFTAPSSMGGDVYGWMCR